MSPGFLEAGPFGFFRMLTSRPAVGMGTRGLSRWARAQGDAARREGSADVRPTGGDRVGLGARTRQHGATAVVPPIERLHLTVELGRLRLSRDLGL